MDPLLATAEIPPSPPPLLPVVRTMVAQIPPLQPMKDHGGADTHAVLHGEESTQKHSVPEGLQPMGRTHAGAGEHCEEGGVAETKGDELTRIPIPCPPAPLRGVGI